MNPYLEPQEITSIKDAIKTLRWILENASPSQPCHQSDLFNLTTNSITELEALITCNHPKEKFELSSSQLMCGCCRKVIDLDDLLKHFN